MPLLSWQDAIGQAAHSADAVCCGRGCVRHDGRVEHGRCSAGRAHDSSCFESDGATWPERAGWKERKELHPHGRSTEQLHTRLQWRTVLRFNFTEPVTVTDAYVSEGASDKLYSS